MRLGRPNSLFFVPAALLLLFFLVVAPTAAAVRSSPEHGARRSSSIPHHDGSRSSVTFPLITWLRDAAIELVFGKHPSSADASAGHVSSSSFSFYQPARYANQMVIRFNLTTADEETALAEAADRLFLDIWAFDNYTGTVDIRLNRELVSSLLTLLPASLHRAFSPLIPDLAVTMQETYPLAAAEAVAEASGSRSSAGARLSSALNEFTSSRSTSSTGVVAALGNSMDNVFFQDYQPLAVIEQWMRLMDVMFPFVHMISVGQSAEGREIYGLRLGSSDEDENGDGNEGGETQDQNTSEPPKKKTILVTGGLHAREWITTSTTNYVAWSLIAGYGKSSVITKLLDHFDVVLVPVVNPDGYEYTWQTDRLWRKTRQGTSFRYCRGLDLDHAFGYAWGGDDAAPHTEPCSETYGGETAFQAVEARSLAVWARNQGVLHGVEFVGFLDLHAYSQQILFPFSYSCMADPPNLENLEELAAGLAKAIRLSTGEQYSISSACEGILSSTGNSIRGRRIESGGGSAIDWFYHELHARYSYQIKLRDTGSYGFLLPASEIVPTGEEIFSAFKYFGDFLLGNNGIERSYEESEAETEAEAESEAVLPEDDGDDQWLELRKRKRR